MNHPITVTINGPADQLTGFRHWWLKTVRDYRLDVHCARCLVGPYERRINKTMATGQPVELGGDLVYLCGVAHRWALNFHAALQRRAGESVSLPTYNEFTVQIDNAVLIPIIPLPDGYQGLGRDFTTCRNYQFAVQMKRDMTSSTSA